MHHAKEVCATSRTYIFRVCGYYVKNLEHAPFLQDVRPKQCAEGNLRLESPPVRVSLFQKKSDSYE